MSVFLASSKGSVQGWGVRKGVGEGEGSPMVWETRQVCKEANHRWFASGVMSLHLAATG